MSPLSRRTVLRGGLAVTAGATVIGASACSRDDGPSAEQLTAEALLPLTRSALSDEAAARSLIPASAEYAAALRVVADQRAAHARALREEITRLHQQTATQLDPSTTSASPGGAPTPTATTVAVLRSQLQSSARQARDTAIARSGYCAGLSGAVSASVTSMVEVQLA